jgi:hypothetical protein
MGACTSCLSSHGARVAGSPLSTGLVLATICMRVFKNACVCVRVYVVPSTFVQGLKMKASP